MSRPNKQRRLEQDSSFAHARAKANALLDMAYSAESSNVETVRFGRSTKRLCDLKAELDASRARVEALFSQPSMDARAIRRRIGLDSPEYDEQPFTVMAGVRR